MYPGAESSGRGEGPSSSSGGGGDVGTTRQAAAEHPTPSPPHQAGPPSQQRQPPSRYESQKRRDWNTFLQYLKNQKPPLSLARCSVAHVIGFLKYLDQFGKTKVHAAGCPYFGRPSPPAPCACPLMQAWGSLDALIGRFRAAFKENGGRPESNPFAAHAVRVYLREVRESQAKSRGISYEKKKRKGNNIPPPAAPAPAAAQRSSSSGAGGGESSSSSAAAATKAAAGTSGTVEGAVAPPQKGSSLS